MTLTELKIISQDFRRRSSALLNSDTDDCAANITRFKQSIDTTPIVKKIIADITEGNTYDFHDCFPTDGRNEWVEVNIPLDEASHIKAMYDYLTNIVNERKGDALGQALLYYHSSRNFNDIIEEFLRMAFSPLISYIISKISEEMISLVNEETTPIIQNNIQTVNGTLAQGHSVNVHNTSNVGMSTTDLQAMLGQAREVLASYAIPAEEKESVIDDIDIVQEQIVAAEPKKPRIVKALGGIKRFASEFAMKLSVSVAATAVAGFDWTKLIHEIEVFLGM